jgi:hypothetical protein
MATTPDKSKNLFPLKAPTRPHDFSLDPLPVPDAIESDSDTAWGLWEHTLQAHDDPSPAPDSDGAYDETVPGSLTGADGKKV